MIQTTEKIFKFLIGLKKMSSGVVMYIFSTINNCADYKVVSVDEFDEWTF